MMQEAAESKKKKKGKVGSADFSILALTCGLVIFGIIMVFSASYYWSIDKVGNPYSFLIKDLIWAGSGFLLLLLFTAVDYHKLKFVAPWLMLFSVALLFATPFIGENINGATRWISLGGLTIMPGEVAKLAIILFASWYLCQQSNKVNDILHGMFPVLVVAGVCAGLIMMQPNMSTAITVVGIAVAILFVAGLEWKWMGILTVGGVFLVLWGIQHGDSYRLQRYTSFLDPFADPLGDGYQVVQGLLALGSGGLRGLGLGKSVQKTLYLPEPQNDFILAIIGEELGYIAVLLLMAAYACLIYRGIRVILRAPDRFGMLLGSGIVMMVGIQVLLNVAVVTSSMPPTGVTLPFVSYGGNALWLFMGSMGILLNISRQCPPETRPRREAALPWQEGRGSDSRSARGVQRIRT